MKKRFLIIKLYFENLRYRLMILRTQFEVIYVYILEIYVFNYSFEIRVRGGSLSQPKKKIG